MPTFNDIQKALVRCLSAEPPQNYCLSPDASQITEVFAEMIYRHATEWPQDSMTEKQWAAFQKWTY